ncbi:MAG: hypothetical protein HXX14_08470 [Bacteroidetes bacterium]|nr:hypothetical protein [Bacteroidota bacterium]
MTRWPIFATFFVLTAIISCNRKNNDSKEIFRKISWIEGNWINEKDSTYHEIWKRTNDSTYIGISTSNNGKDSLVEENLKIILHKNTITFYNEIEEQTEESTPQAFTFSSSNSDTLIFTNKENFYPNKITYKHLTDNNISVKIERIGAGDTIKYEFILKRKK